MRTVSKSEIIRSVPARYREQYANYDKAHRFPDGRIVGEIMSALDAATTDAEILAALPSWCENACDECGADSNILVRIGSEPDYEVRWQDLCLTCIEAAHALCAQGVAQNVNTVASVATSGASVAPVATSRCGA